jgi:hypothetical protein
MTSAGETVMKDLQLVEKTVVNRMVKGLSSKELDQFVIIAGKMTDNIKKIQKENSNKGGNE